MTGIVSKYTILWSMIGQTSSRLHVGSHQRLWRVCLHPRFLDGSCRSCSLAQRHLGQRLNKKKKEKRNKLNPQSHCITLYVLLQSCAVSLPVALAYTTRARGSWFCRSSTALPIFVDVAFLALWHSSKMICLGLKLRTTAQTPKCRVQLCPSTWACQKEKDTTPSKSGLHQSRICLILVRCCPPAWLSPIRAE